MGSVSFEHPRLIGNRDNSFGSVAHDAAEFVEHCGLVPDVFENFKTEEEVDSIVAEGQMQTIVQYRQDRGERFPASHT